MCKYENDFATISVISLIVQSTNYAMRFIE